MLVHAHGHETVDDSDWVSLHILQRSDRRYRVGIHSSEMAIFFHSYVIVATLRDLRNATLTSALT